MAKHSKTSRCHPRVIITGCSGGGKSTLLKELSLRGFSTVPEAGRQIVQEQTEAGGDGLPWVNLERFCRLCVARGVEAYNAANGVTFFDRSFLDNVSGLQELQICPPDYDALITSHRFASHVFFAPPWPEIFEQDAERRHGFEEAVAECERLSAFYPHHGYELVPLPKISVSKRAEFVVAHVLKMS